MSCCGFAPTSSKQNVRVLGEWSPVKHCGAHRGKQQVNYIYNRGPFSLLLSFCFENSKQRPHQYLWTAKIPHTLT